MDCSPRAGEGVAGAAVCFADCTSSTTLPRRGSFPGQGKGSLRRRVVSLLRNRHDPRNRSWTRPSGPRWGALARRDDALRAHARKEEQRRQSAAAWLARV